jgi:hypothetical protein
MRCGADIVAQILLVIHHKRSATGSANSAPNARVAALTEPLSAPVPAAFLLLVRHRELNARRGYGRDNSLFVEKLPCIIFENSLFGGERIAPELIYQSGNSYTVEGLY